MSFFQKPRLKLNNKEKSVEKSRYKRLLSWNEALKKQVPITIPKDVFSRTEKDQKFDAIINDLKDETINDITNKIREEFATINNPIINLSNQNIRGFAAETVGLCLKTAKCSNLDLSNNLLRDEDISVLTKYLQNKNSYLNLLDLSNNRIGIQGAKTIAKLLTQNRTLKNINIDTNAIAASGIEELAQALTKNDSIEHFSINWNPLEMFAEEFYFTLIRNSTLLVLKLGYCNLKDRVAEALSDGLMNNSSLQELFLFGNEITDQGATALCIALHQNYNLKYLNLRSNLITDVAGNEFCQLLDDKTSSKVALVVNLLNNKLSVEVENELNIKNQKVGRKKTQVIIPEIQSLKSRLSIFKQRTQSGYSYVNNRFYQVTEEESDEESYDEKESAVSVIEED